MCVCVYVFSSIIVVDIIIPHFIYIFINSISSFLLWVNLVTVFSSFSLSLRCNTWTIIYEYLLHTKIFFNISIERFDGILLKQRLAPRDRVLIASSFSNLILLWWLVRTIQHWFCKESFLLLATFARRFFGRWQDYPSRVGDHVAFWPVKAFGVKVYTKSKLKRM